MLTELAVIHTTYEIEFNISLAVAPCVYVIVHTIVCAAATAQLERLEVVAWPSGLG